MYVGGLENGRPQRILLTFYTALPSSLTVSKGLFRV